MEKSAAHDAANAKLREYKQKLTPEAVAAMKSAEMHATLKDIKYPGRSKLRVLDGTLKRALLHVLDLRAVGVAPRTET